jgi:glucose-6-phosphate 1-dehydrogenase
MADQQVDALVIFGATGDLAKLETFPALVGLVERGVLDVPVVGVAKSGWGPDQFRDYARKSLELNDMNPNSPAAVKMLGLLRYVDGDLDDSATYQAMSDEIGDGKRVLYYLEVPPPLFGRIAEGISGAGRADNARVMVEKPFGTDLASAQPLNQTMHQYFDEDDIYRVDHWLGLDPVENMLFVRFGNKIDRAASQPGARGQHPDHDGGGVRCLRPGPVLRPDRRHARRAAEPHAAGAGLGAGRAAGRQGPGLLAVGEGRRDRRARPADS